MENKLQELKLQRRLIDAQIKAIETYPKYTYADAKQILDDFELAVIADSHSGGGHPADKESIRIEARRARKTIIDMLKEVTSGRS